MVEDVKITVFREETGTYGYTSSSGWVGTGFPNAKAAAKEAYRQAHEQSKEVEIEEAPRPQSSNKGGGCELLVIAIGLAIPAIMMALTHAVQELAR